MAGKENDLDETRRLLYMALLASKTKKYNLAGTLVNALRHHSQLTGVAMDDASLEDNVVMLINDEDETGLLKLKTWARDLIAEISLTLDGAE